MKLDPAQWSICSASLVETIDPATDSIRFYHLGNNWAERIDHHGIRRDQDIDGLLIIQGPWFKKFAANPKHTSNGTMIREFRSPAVTAGYVAWI